MSAYIKSLDSSHYVSLGDEGFFNRGSSQTYPYQGGEGVDFEANLRISTLDYGTFHLYTNSWGQTYDWGNGWIRYVNCLLRVASWGGWDLAANIITTVATTQLLARRLESLVFSRSTVFQRRVLLGPTLSLNGTTLLSLVG